MHVPPPTCPTRLVSRGAIEEAINEMQEVDPNLSPLARHAPRWAPGP